jgi:hypothetical protein
MRLRQDSQERDIYAIAVERIVGVEAGVRARRQSHAILYTGGRRVVFVSGCAATMRSAARVASNRNVTSVRTSVDTRWVKPQHFGPAIGRSLLRDEGISGAVSAEGAEAPAEITAR